MSVEVVDSPVAVLGEAPRWDAERGELVWVDLWGGAIHRYHPAREHVRSVAFPAPVSAALPGTGGDLIVAAGRRLLRWEHGAAAELAVLTDDRNLRFNDAAVDATGRVWLGTMRWQGSLPATPGQLAKFENGSLTVVLDDLALANGLGWSPDGRTMYVVDTDRHTLTGYGFDAAAGELHAPALVIEVDPALGKPDGLAVGPDGDIWVALFGGGALARFRPDGVLRERIALPVSQPTACAFGGPGLRDLYITTASRGLVTPEPDAGKLLRLRLG